MKVLSCQQMRKLEQAAVEHGQTYLGLMEQAGTGAAKVIREQAKLLQKAIVFCGKGNNGGDGFVIARRLQEWGAYITVVLMEGSPATPDAAHMFAQMKQVEVLSFQDEQVFSALPRRISWWMLFMGSAFAEVCGENLPPSWKPLTSRKPQYLL